MTAALDGLRDSDTVAGWDIGGVNTKVARSVGGAIVAAHGRPYELQRDPAALVPLLQEMAHSVGAGAGAVHAVTMTAELSQLFRTKREGVAFVLDAVEAAFDASRTRVFAVDGRWLTIGAARRAVLAVAAANWSATAHAVAGYHPDAVLIDVGTTTTDVIPIAGGVVVARGRTDPERLTSGELVYSGALRTPAEALAPQVPIGTALAGVSAEGFALAGDVHLWRGDLAPADYTVATPDGRPATRAFAGERLARVVCADRDMLDAGAISAIADALAAAQVSRLAEAIGCVCRHQPSLRMAVVTGLGSFVGVRAARAAGLQPVLLSSQLGEAAARCAPAAAVALLLDQALHGADTSRQPSAALAVETVRRTASNAPLVDTVVKLGGGVLAHPGHFGAALAAIGAASRRHALLVVPGGGPFADAVRQVDRDCGLSDAAAHWMAVLAMDQYAHLVAERLAGGALVATRHGIASALAAGQVPVLAPSQWLRDEDPLPHTWDVTSDSIAGWIAGQVGARRLVLIKPPGAGGENVVDPCFRQSLPPGVTVQIVAADNSGDLEAALRA